MDSTSSAINPIAKYDVFLSFRGTDTRDNVVSFLHLESVRNGIETYIDNRLQGGDVIEPALLRKIEESLISVVILSEHYADSTFCLRELSKILECKETKGQIVIPVFYKVSPDDVGNLCGIFGDALLLHEKKYSLEEASKWRQALEEIAKMKGWDSNVTKPDTILIREIVDDINKKLKQMPSSGSSSSNSGSFVGITSRVKAIESMLSFESPSVLIVGIWGMGGIGKSTTAKAVYHQNYRRFDGHLFFENDRKQSQKYGIQEILREALKNNDLNIQEDSSKRMLQRIKVLIILDNVNSHQELKDLVGEAAGLLGEGSRIIVTSRDRQLLINKCDEDKIYEVKNLDDRDSLELLSLHAFHQKNPAEGYTELSKGVISYVKGIPLVLEVLGSSLYKRSKEYWENLEERNGIDRLADLCLIKIVDNKIWMHDVVQQLGQEIVVKEHNDPGKRSRLWKAEDILPILINHQGTEKAEAMSLQHASTEIKLRPTAFKGIDNLSGVELAELDMSYSQLEQLWNEYQNEYSQLTNLKSVTLKGSHNLRLINLSKFPNLEVLNLAECSSLVELPDSIKHCTKLTELDLSLCESFRTLPSSIEKLSQLVELDLSGCKNIRSLPNSIGELECLASLHLFGCSKLASLPDSIGQLKCLAMLDLCYCKKLASLQCLPGLPSSLQVLDASACISLESVASLLTQGEKKYEAGNEDFKFTDCNELGENESLKFMNDTRLRIQRNATSWFNQKQSQLASCHPQGPGERKWEISSLSEATCIRHHISLPFHGNFNATPLKDLIEEYKQQLYPANEKMETTVNLSNMVASVSYFAENEQHLKFIIMFTSKSRISQTLLIKASGKQNLCSPRFP
ncbi:unnamed protein product [Dovyalis caffra]|uniref:TIR domain-containing protein n=1 Tax=Dovyalis caffra TaxID=77055 RepID=A0AAV1RNW0_9ROSI|nr:unnamed protein product [Dovyalis caffra]